MHFVKIKLTKKIPKNTLIVVFSEYMKQLYSNTIIASFTLVPSFLSYAWHAVGVGSEEMLPLRRYSAISAISSLSGIIGILLLTYIAQLCKKEKNNVRFLFFVSLFVLFYFLLFYFSSAWVHTGFTYISVGAFWVDLINIIITMCMVFYIKLHSHD